MKNDLKPATGIPLVVKYQGMEYIALDALIAAATEKTVLGNAVVLMKVGADQGATLKEVLERVLAGYVLQVSGRCKGLQFSPIELAQLQSTLEMKFQGGLKP